MSETRTYGDPTAPGAARRQREMLVEILETGWLEFSKKEDGYEFASCEVNAIVSSVS